MNFFNKALALWLESKIINFFLGCLVSHYQILVRIGLSEKKKKIGKIYSARQKNIERCKKLCSFY